MDSICVFMSALIWGLLPIFWKLFSGISPVYIVAARFLWSFVLLIIYFSLKKQLNKLIAAFKNQQYRRILSISAVLVFLNYFGSVLAVSQGRIIDSSLASYISPMITIIVGHLFFKEGVSPLQWLSIGIIAAGILSVIIYYRHIPYLVFFISLTFPVYGAIKKQAKLPTFVSLAIESIFEFPICLLIICFYEVQGRGMIHVFQGVKLLLVPAIGAATLIPMALYAKGIKNIPYMLGGIVMFICPTIQFLTSVFLYHESFTHIHKVLFSAVWIGVAIYLMDMLVQKEKLHNRLREDRKQMP